MEGALVRLLARRGIDDPEGPYLCGEGGSPGRLHSLEVVFVLELGDGDEYASFWQDVRDFLGVSLALQVKY